MEKKNKSLIQKLISRSQKIKKSVKKFHERGKAAASKQTKRVALSVGYPPKKKRTVKRKRRRRKKTRR